MSGVAVEAPEPDDLEELADLWVALVADQRPLGTHLRASENRDTARDFLAQSIAAETVRIARGPAGLVGFVDFHVERGVYEQDVDRGVIDNVFVRPAYRDLGVGSRLLDAAESALRGADVGVLAIAVLAENDRARRLYEQRGYRPHRVELERPADGRPDDDQPGESDGDAPPAESDRDSSAGGE